MSFNVVERLVGERFTTQDNSRRLPSYALTDINGRFQLPVDGLRMAFKAEINNVFNRSYEMFESYPMPGRTFRLSLSCEM